MSEYKYESLTQGLDELVKRMKKDMPKWNDELSQAYYTMRGSSSFLAETIRKGGSRHFAWHLFVPMTDMMYRFGPLHWMISYKQLSEHFDVPMTWLHVLRMRVNTDPIRQTWEVKDDYKLLDDDGYLLETTYGAYCDGVDLGLIPDEGEMSFLQRQPDMVEMSEALDEQFKKYAEDHDMTIEEAMFNLTLEHDMTVA